MELGMIGLGRMGANMVRRLLRGWTPLRRVRCEAGSPLRAGKWKAPVAADSLASLVKQLTPPRPVWLMLPAALVDDQITQLDSAALIRATSSSTEGTPTIPTTSGVPRSSRSRGTALRWMWAPAAGCAVSSEATA